MDRESFECFGISADFSWCAVIKTWPRRRDCYIALRGEECDLVFLVEACHPEAMDEEDGWFG
jgi:hypothetical protein